MAHPCRADEDGEAHLVPCPGKLWNCCETAHLYRGAQLSFPNYRNPKVCMTATTLNRALERMGFNGKDSIGFSAHGFRATAQPS